MAVRLGKPRSTYASWEDDVDPSLNDLHEIAKIVGVTLADLLTENSENIDNISVVNDGDNNNKYNSRNGEGDYKDKYIGLLEKQLKEAERRENKLQESLDILTRRQQVIAAMNEASFEVLLIDLAVRKELDPEEMRRNVRNRAFSKMSQYEAKGIEIDQGM